MNSNYQRRMDEEGNFRSILVPVTTALIGAAGVGLALYRVQGLDGNTAVVAIVAGIYGYRFGVGLQGSPDKLKNLYDNLRYNPDVRIQYLARLMGILAGTAVGWYAGGSLNLALLGALAGFILAEILYFIWVDRQVRKQQMYTAPGQPVYAAGPGPTRLETAICLLVMFVPAIIGLLLGGYWGYAEFGWVGAVIAAFLGGFFGFIFGAMILA